jgi:hypothetical protein
MIVKNINGTSQSVCSCGSWLQHWRNFSNQQATICRALGCGRNDLVGAHVQKDVSYDNSWYIVPLCNGHNHASGSVELVAGTVLVSANKKLTCEA